MTETHSLGEWETRLGELCHKNHISPGTYVRLQEFAQSLLLAQKEGFRREIEGMKKPRCRCMCEKSNEAYRYNLVIDAVLTKLDTNGI